MKQFMSYMTYSGAKKLIASRQNLRKKKPGEMIAADWVRIVLLGLRLSKPNTNMIAFGRKADRIQKN